jgi:hypothetical protein
MIEKYSCYKFEILRTIVGHLQDGWSYKIYMDCNYSPDIESDEWFETEQQARFAAIGHICKLEDGPDEPDYDAPSAQEMYQRAHDDRQKLRGK